MASTIHTMNLLRALTTGRWLVALTVMALAWGVTAGGTVAGTGGLLSILAVGALTLCWFAMFDLSMLERTGTIRLALTQRHGEPNIFLLTPALTTFAIVSGALGVILLMVSFWIGVMALVALGGMFLLKLGSVEKDQPKTYRALEWELVLAAVVLPFVLLRAPSTTEGIGTPDGALTATLIIGLGIGVWMLLCTIRDAGMDEGAQNATTATTLGRVGASWVAMIAIIAMVAFASHASDAGIWNWPVPAAIALAGVIVAWSLGTRSEESTVPVWAGVCVFVSLVVAVELPKHTGVLTESHLQQIDADRADEGESAEAAEDNPVDADADSKSDDSNEPSE